jgi:hypothetical protein
VRVAWDDTSGLGNDTWQLEVPPAEGFVTLGSLRDHEVLKGKVKLNVQSTFDGTESVGWSLDQSGRYRAWGSNADVLDTTQYADGVYTLVASADHAGGTDTSQPRIVYVLNGKLSGELHFLNLTEGQTVAAKTLVLQIESSASPVPFRNVVFHAKHVESGEEIEKSTVNVASKLALSWRMDIPGGDYDVWLEGSAGDQSISSEPIRIHVQGWENGR